jgi:hypothetical protein
MFTLQLLEDELNEDAYLADVAGLFYGLSPEGTAGVCASSDHAGLLLSVCDLPQTALLVEGVGCHDCRLLFRSSDAETAYDIAK